jgi:two-component system alkaline phosphatase synthesis response regulator PhoP
LTPRELALLSLFAREKGRIVSRRTLLQEVWGMMNVDAVQTRTVDMHIAKLRKKVAPDGDSTIETVRGAGYRFNG